MSSRLTTIVVPLDGTPEAERSIGPAKELAHLVGGGVSLISAVEDVHLRAGQLDYLQEVSARYGTSGDDPDVWADVDPHAVDTISRFAGDDRLICMATSASIYHLSGYTGSMAEKVIQRTGEPTVLVGPDAERTPAFEVDRVLVPLDGSAASHAALLPARWWAELLDRPIRLVAVGDPDDVAITDDDLAELAVAHASETVPVDAERVVAEDVDGAIVELAGGALVVMATHGRTGIQRITLGSVAAQVVRHAPRPVVVVCPRPDDALS